MACCKKRENYSRFGKSWMQNRPGSLQEPPITKETAVVYSLITAMMTVGWMAELHFSEESLSEGLPWYVTDLCIPVKVNLCLNLIIFSGHHLRQCPLDPNEL